MRSLEAVPRSIAVEVTAAPVRDTAEAEEAIAKLGREPGGGLIVPPDAFTIVHDQLLVRLAQQHRVPAVYSYRISVAQGGLSRMDLIPSTISGVRLLMSIASSREPSRPIFPFSSQRSSN